MPVVSIKIAVISAAVLLAGNHRQRTVYKYTGPIGGENNRNNYVRVDSPSQYPECPGGAVVCLIDAAPDPLWPGKPDLSSSIVIGLKLLPDQRE